jgi:hypothetical protein
MLSILVHKEMKRHLSGLIHLALFLAIPNPSGSFLHPQMRSHDRIQTILSSELIGSKMKSGTTPNEQNNKILPCLMLIGTILTGTIDKTSIHDAAFAYGSDYVGETVVNAVKNLKEARGDELASFKALENIGDIITEGKGIGGSISYSEFIQLSSSFIVLVSVHLRTHAPIPGMQLVLSWNVDMLQMKILQYIIPD